jgi:hypothetical protein
VVAAQTDLEADPARLMPATAVVAADRDTQDKQLNFYE